MHPCSRRLGACSTLALTLALACSDDRPHDPTGPTAIIQPSEPGPSFAPTPVDDDAYGPAFADVEDFDGDGRLDLLVSSFGSFELVRGDGPLPRGRVSIYLQGETLDTWERLAVVDEEDDIVWPNAVSFEDVDGDGDLDVMVPYGFLTCTIKGTPCGGLAWMENDGQGGFVRHDIVEGGGDAFFHEVVLIDMDGDDVKDLLTTAETFGFPAGEAATQWFKGDDSEDRFDKTPRVIGDMGGSRPQPFDVDGDGDLDLVSGEFFKAEPATAVWIERVGGVTASEPAGRWLRHVIDDRSGPSIQAVVVEDLFGDGRDYVVASNHTNVHADEYESLVTGYAIPDDPTGPWQREILSEGIEATPNEGFERNLAPGIFGAGDIDGDGDTDLLVSGDGDPRVFWLEQTGVGAMTTHVLAEDMPQAGGMLVEDLDGDGKNELVVCSYEQDRVLIYQRRE